ncbi:transglycosylase domain-containing protein [Thermodesulfobacteriota bacterium]
MHFHVLLMLNKMIKKYFLLFLKMTVLAVVIGIMATVWLVVFSPGEAVRQENIERILAMESPVYYRDGKNTLGVFFEESHRQYVPYEKIPAAFVNSIIAAEDNTFFDHYGVDFGGITRAFVANLKAGRVVQGGSTITQQTAKNLFKRKERSLVAKLGELLNAWRLEYHYSKEKILEFYSNQFYVSGNGRGLGVAARYYFDKDVSELNTLECAFIAGSVKRPNFYNPFIKKSEEAISAALRRARLRVAYVLKQLVRSGKITRLAYEEYLEQEIPFKQGQMYYSVNTLMDLVKEAMTEPEVDEALTEHGIDNIATSGIKVVTTLDKNLQEAGLYALRKELSRLDVRLRGYERQEVQEEYNRLNIRGTGKGAEGDFLFGRVLEVHSMPDVAVTVGFGNGHETNGSPDGIIDKKGLRNLLTPLMKNQKNLWTRATDNDLPDLLGRIQEGDMVYVSVRSVHPSSGTRLLDLEKYPEVQGALMVLKEGTIRSMVGGMENRYFNRAVMAKRSMGSVIKPLVYAAALQLGWNNLDLLSNQRDVFVYQDEPYFPRPDHATSFRGVSMSWAGVHSENVATVWLLYHLCDYLSPAQFRELVDHLGLGRNPGESYERYKRRIRDDYGIVVTRETLHDIAYSRAVKGMEPDLIFSGKIDEYELLKMFHYGAGFPRFLEENAEEAEAALQEEEQDRQLIRELEKRKGILVRNFLRYKKLLQLVESIRDGDVTEEFLEFEITYTDESFDVFSSDEFDMEYPFEGPLQEGETEQGINGKIEPVALLHNLETGKYLFGAFPPGENWRVVSMTDLEEILSSFAFDEEEDFWNSIRIEGVLSTQTIKDLDEEIEREFERIVDFPEFSDEILHSVRDFRVLVALQYLTGFSRAIGIKSNLDPVLSFPLGSNVISVLEVARAYETLVAGKLFVNGADQASDALSIIERIEDGEGNVLYVPKKTTRRVLAPETALAVSDILRNVVKYGTGRYAYKNVRLRSRDSELNSQLQELDLRVPVLGKTGTANRFTNAAFAGVVPGLGQGNGLVLENGYTVAAYTGFDDNKPMVMKTTRITGASGALPIWTRMVNTILETEDYAEGMDIVDFSFSGFSEVPLRYPDLGQTRVSINTKRGWGGIAAESEGNTPAMTARITTFGDILDGGRVRPARFFKPYWNERE